MSEITLLDDIYSPRTGKNQLYTYLSFTIKIVIEEILIKK